MEHAKGQPGGYAFHRAQELRREWESRVKRKVGWAFWLVAALTIVGGVLTGDYLALLLGCVAGLAIGIYAGLLVGPDSAFDWERGAEGEVRTARELTALEAQGWTVFHDIQRSGYNWDHVAIGPPGIFLLETKDVGATVTIVDGLPTVEGPSRSRRDDYAKWAGWAKKSAAEIHDEIEQQEGRAPWVKAVIVLWGDFPQGLAEGDKVVYVSGDRLVEWLSSLEPELSPGRQGLAAGCLATLLPAGKRARSTQ